VQLEHEAVPEHALRPLAAEHEPRPAGAGGAPGPDRPATAQTQVGAEHEAALETEDEVLADRLHGLEPAAVELLRRDRRPRTRVRRLDLEPLPHEGLEPARGAVDRVPLGHLATVARCDTVSTMAAAVPSRARAVPGRRQPRRLTSGTQHGPPGPG
jgi:hypothetical protein